MREIKFRAWDGKRMVPVATFDQQYATKGILGSSEVEYTPTQASVTLADGSRLMFDIYLGAVDERVMQYTGLKDKHGFDIFEGDIFVIYRLDDEPVQDEQKYLVKWDSDHAMFHCGDHHGSPLGIGNAEFIEVIGNIYENPELLKRGDDE